MMALYAMLELYGVISLAWAVGDRQAFNYPVVFPLPLQRYRMH